MPATLASLIREGREARGLSQREAGEVTKVHFVTLSRIEKGWIPSFKTAKKIVQALGIEVADSDLMTMCVKTPPQKTKAIEALVRAFDRKDVNEMLKIINQHVYGR